MGKKKSKEQEQSELVVKQETAPCGCQFTEYGDGRKLRVPCIPHAFEECAHRLVDAANMLGHIGSRMLEVQKMAVNQRIQQAANQAVDGKKNPGGKIV